MRITIKYFEGYPELEAELSRYPVRVRAERVRNLASIGLSMLHQAQIASNSRAYGHAENKQASEVVGHREDDSQFAEDEQLPQQPPAAKTEKPASSAMIKNLFGQV